MLPARAGFVVAASSVDGTLPEVATGGGGGSGGLKEVSAALDVSVVGGAKVA